MRPHMTGGTGGRLPRLLLLASGAVVLGVATLTFNLRQEGPPPESAAEGAQQPAISPAGEVSLDRNFYLIIDGSGSMTEGGCAGRFSSRVAAAQWAVKSFVSESVPDDVRLGLYVFDTGGARERVPLGQDNRRRIVTEVDRISGGGGTPLNAAIRQGVQVLVAQRERQLGYGDFYLVVATDGAATDGPGDASDGVRSALQESISIITIGYCLPQGHPLAQRSLSYRDANDPEELLAALKETQGELPYFDVATFGGR